MEFPYPAKPTKQTMCMYRVRCSDKHCGHIRAVHCDAAGYMKKSYAGMYVCNRCGKDTMHSVV